MKNYNEKFLFQVRIQDFNYLDIDQVPNNDSIMDFVYQNIKKESSHKFQFAYEASLHPTTYP
jgi:hypothetical protein